MNKFVIVLDDKGEQSQIFDDNVMLMKLNLIKINVGGVLSLSDKLSWYQEWARIIDTKLRILHMKEAAYNPYSLKIQHFTSGMEWDNPIMYHHNR